MELSIEILDVRDNQIYLRASDGTTTEALDFALPLDIADEFSKILSERPFRERKPGHYVRWIEGLIEGGGSPEKFAIIRINKGRSRVRRKVSIPQPMFLTLWNIFHSKAVPSRQSGYRRTT